MTRALAVAAALFAVPALAQSATAKSTWDVPGRNFFNLRVGAASSSSHPELCVEGSPIDLLSVEGCGTGSGFLHKDPDPEIAHFRAKLRLASWETEIGHVQPRLGFGFAELQIGEDAEGFDFGGVGPFGNETAGPEVGASIRTVYPLGRGFDLIGEVNASAAWFSHAPQMRVPQPVIQPSVSVTVGVGF